MRNFLPDHYQTVLEIGCGEGNFAQNLKVGCEVWGLEPCKEAAQKASHKLDKVLCGKIEETYKELPNEYFDLVICNDVIEHMEDHEWFFSMIKKKMKNNAFLVGSIPNVRYYYNLKEILIYKDWEYKKEGILDSTHLRFFTEQSIKRTLLKNSFNIEKFCGINKINYNDFGINSIINNIFVKMLIIFTFGYYKDIEYLQFAFLAKK